VLAVRVQEQGVSSREWNLEPLEVQQMMGGVLKSSSSGAASEGGDK
jgi:hypothetical protein